MTTFRSAAFVAAIRSARKDFLQPALRFGCCPWVMTDVDVIRIEGVGMGPEAVTAALAKASAKVDAVVAKAGSEQVVAA